MIKHYGVTLAAFAFAVLATGCSDSGSSLSPTSASSLSDSSGSSGGAASGTNAVSSTSQQNSNSQSQQNSNGGHNNETHGAVSGLSGSCPNLSFTVNGTAITTNASTTFEDGPCTAIQNGAQVEVEGAKQPDGSLVASEVETENGQSKAEIKGDVAGLGGSCPNLTFTINGTAVTTNGSTKFEDGPCTGIQNGTRVEVEGLSQPNGSVVANEVEIEEVELKGVVAGLGGACPNLTFTVNGTMVTTNSATKFEDALCSSIQNGSEVEVEGFRQPDGSVLAGKVEIEDVELEGLVSGLGGSCPNLTFTVNGTVVTTTSSTKFDDGHCSDVQNGAEIEVKGLRQPNGSALAQKVEVDDDHHRQVELKGLVSGLGGACPAISFTVNGVSVTTSSSTEFDDGPCASVQSGAKVEVKGTRQPDGSVVAREVDIEDVEIEGAVSGLSGACPTLTFTVKGMTVVTNSLTKFDDGPCTGVQNGIKVEVEGLRQSNGSLLAQKVELDDD